MIKPKVSNLREIHRQVELLQLSHLGQSFLQHAEPLITFDHGLVEVQEQLFQSEQILDLSAENVEVLIGELGAVEVEVDDS